MNEPTGLQANKARSERLDTYVARDPLNEPLLADAFEAAVAAGRLDAADRHLAAGLALGASAPWKFREATFAMAQNRWPEAQALLAQLAADTPQPAVHFNLGYVHFRQAAYSACAAMLEPLLENQPAAQALWLRSLHQLGEVERAWTWVEEARSAQRVLDADVCGVASLIALDADQVSEAEQLAERALQQLPTQAEALVARGSVALGHRDAASATELANRVLQQRRDGRAYSLRGFARLLAQDLPSALADLEQAVELMPGHVGTWQGLGWTRLLLQDSGGAEAAFAQALALDRNFAESHGSLAVALVLSGRSGEARSHIERARRLDARSMSARYAELLLSGQVGDREAIEKLAGELLARGPVGPQTQAPPDGGASST